MQASRVKIIYYPYEAAARVQLHFHYIYSRLRMIYVDDELRYNLANLAIYIDIPLIEQSAILDEQDYPSTLDDTAWRSKINNSKN